MFLRPLTAGDPGGSSVASSVYKAAMEAASLRFAAFSNVEIALSIAALKSNVLAIVAILPVVELLDEIKSDATTLLRTKLEIGWRKLRKGSLSALTESASATPPWRSCGGEEQPPLRP